MSNKDLSFVRHEILNKLTVINFLVTDSKIRDSLKAEILSNLKLINFLTAQRQVILGKEKKFYKQNVELSEVLDMLHLLTADDCKRKKVKVTFPKTEMTVQADRDIVLNGLHYTLDRLMDFAKRIDIRVDEKKNKISLKYDSDQRLKIDKGTLIDFLKKGPEDSEIFFRVGTHLMNTTGVKTNFKKGLVELSF